MKKNTIKTETITVKDIRMIRASGYGQYKIVVDFTVDGESKSMSFHSTDSQLWDNDDKTDADLFSAIGGEQAILDRI